MCVFQIKFRLFLVPTIKSGILFKQDFLSVHVKAHGPYTWKLRNYFDKNINDQEEDKDNPPKVNFWLLRTLKYHTFLHVISRVI